MKGGIEVKKNLTDKSATSSQIDENKILEENNPALDYNIVVPDQVVDEVITEAQPQQEQGQQGQQGQIETPHLIHTNKIMLLKISQLDSAKDTN